METRCNICPRNCNVDRSKQMGYCKTHEKIKISKVMIHHFEEPIISGCENDIRGSGAIFFSNCNLRCVYCQNSEISTDGVGKEISIQKLADIFKQLENAGAYNINLVTPTHFTEQIIEALKIYNEIGYSTRVKAGAHVTITAPTGFEYSMTLPHGKEKRFN